MMVVYPLTTPSPPTQRLTRPPGPATEVLGLVRGLTGPAQQAVEVAARLRERCQSYRSSATTAAGVAELYDRLAAHLRALVRSCEDNVYSFPRDNAVVLTDAVNHLRNMLIHAATRIDALLRNINSRLFRFTQASYTEAELSEMREEANRAVVNVGQITNVLSTAAAAAEATGTPNSRIAPLPSARPHLLAEPQVDRSSYYNVGEITNVLSTAAAAAESTGTPNSMIAPLPSARPHLPAEPQVDRPSYYDVFISTARVDTSLARPLHDALTSDGLRVFLDDQNVRVSGVPMSEQLAAATLVSKAAIFLLTPHFVACMGTMYELMRFLKLRDQAMEEGREPPLLIPVFYTLRVRDCYDPLLPYREELLSVFRENGFFREENQRICSTPQAMDVLRRLSNFSGLRFDHQYESVEAFAQRTATQLITDLRIGLSSTSTGVVSAATQQNMDSVSQQENDMYDIYISYTWSERESVAYPLYRALTDAGLHCFIDDESIRRSRATVDEQFKNAMRRSKAAVFVLSADFVARRNPMLEVQKFLKRLDDARYGQEVPVLIPLFYRLTKEECQDVGLPYNPRYMRLFEAHGFFEYWRQRDCSTMETMDALRRLTRFGGVNIGEHTPTSVIIQETRNLLMPRQQQAEQAD